MTAAAHRARIARVETIPLRIPFRTPFKIAQGAARPSAEVFVVRLHTDDGSTGIGETQAWRRQGSSETLQSLQAAVDHHFAPLLLGRSPFDIASIMAGLEEAVYHSLYAQAAISDALFDLQGKLLGVPVHALLGGKCRDTLEACAVLSMKPTVEETVAGARKFWEAGYRAFTVKVGVDPAADVANVRELRMALGERAILRVDANAGMDFDSALSLLRKLDPYELDAAEQMLPLFDLHGMAELARKVGIPLMADESVSTDHDLMEVIRLRAATVVQTKIAKNGGIWHGRRLWHIADAAGMRIYPGNHPSTSIATSAAAHLGAAWPKPLLEGAFPVGIANLAEDIVTEPVRMDGPHLTISDQPGLGVTLDEGQVNKFRVAI